MVIGGEEALQCRADIGAVKLFRVSVLDGKQAVIEEVHVALDVRPCCKVLTGLFAAATDGKDRLCIIGVCVQELTECGVKLPRPCACLPENFFRRHAGNHILADIVQLVEVEQASRRAHLLDIEGELGIGLVRVLCVPLLVVGVEQGHDILANAGGGVAHAAVVIHIRAHIALGEFLLVAVFVKSHDLRNVQILRQTETEIAEQHQVLGKARKPLLAADDVRSSHQMVVHRVGEVIGGNAVALEQDKIFVVFGNLQLALNQVGEGDFLFGIAVRKQAQDKRVAVLQMCLDFLRGKLPLLCLFLGAVVALVFPVAGFDLRLLVERIQRFQFLFGRKNRVGKPAFHKILCKNVVNRSARTLLVRTVSAVIGYFSVPVENRALVKMNSVVRQCADQTLRRSGHFALCVGIFNPQIEHAARLVRQTFSDGGGEQTAEVHKARGARSKTGHFRAFWEIPRRIFRLHIRRCFGYVREQQFRQCFKIHGSDFLFLHLVIPIAASASPSLADSP